MEKNEVQKKGFFDKAMDFIEKIGNAMPDPVSLFIIVYYTGDCGCNPFRNFRQHGLQCGASRYGQNHSGY